MDPPFDVIVADVVRPVMKQSSTLFTWLLLSLRWEAIDSCSRLQNSVVCTHTLTTLLIVIVSLIIRRVVGSV